MHPQAVVTGNVIIGKDVYIEPGAAFRGDWGAKLGIRLKTVSNLSFSIAIRKPPALGCYLPKEITGKKKSGVTLRF